MYSMTLFEHRGGNVLRNVDELENSFFDSDASGAGRFRCDISEKRGGYLLEAELPGFKKEEISLDVCGDVLSIGAGHRDASDEKDEQGKYIRRQRRYGSYLRSFSTEGIDAARIKADYYNGVLTLDLPKAKKVNAKMFAEE